MTDFTITIEDESSLAGITAARDAYNLTLQAEVDDVANPGTMIPNPAILNTDEQYVQFVMGTAAQSYARQYNT
jgi:hypothetical protein